MVYSNNKSGGVEVGQKNPIFGQWTLWTLEVLSIHTPFKLLCTHNTRKGHLTNCAHLFLKLQAHSTKTLHFGINILNMNKDSPHKKNLPCVVFFINYNNITDISPPSLQLVQIEIVRKLIQTIIHRLQPTV